MRPSFRNQTCVWLASLTIFAAAQHALATQSAVTRSKVSLEQGFCQPPNAAPPVESGLLGPVRLLSAQAMNPNDSHE